jgi:hypothetical protein
MLNGQRQVSIQKMVHMLDKQQLVICSDMITYVILAQGQALRSETDRSKKKVVITVYRNRQEEHYHLSLEQFFYQIFITYTFKTKSNNNTSNSMNCKPQILLIMTMQKGCSSCINHGTRMIHWINCSNTRREQLMSFYE